MHTPSSKVLPNIFDLWVSKKGGKKEKWRLYIPLIRKLSEIPSCWNKNTEKNSTYNTFTEKNVIWVLITDIHTLDI